MRILIQRKNGFQANIVEDESLESSESSVEENFDKWVGVYEGTEKMEFRVLKTNENHSVRLKLDKTSPWCSAKNVILFDEYDYGQCEIEGSIVIITFECVGILGITIDGQTKYCTANEKIKWTESVIDGLTSTCVTALLDLLGIAEGMKKESESKQRHKLKEYLLNKKFKLPMVSWKNFQRLSTNSSDSVSQDVESSPPPSINVNIEQPPITQPVLLPPVLNFRTLKCPVPRCPFQSNDYLSLRLHYSQHHRSTHSYYQPYQQLWY